MKIALCSGHSKQRKGAVNKTYNLNEHDEARKVNLYLAELLKSSGHSVSIFNGNLTHKITCINHGKFDLAIDLHFNAGGGHGCEVVYVPKSIVRKEQAKRMSSAIARFLDLKDRGPKEGYYMGGVAPGTRPDAFVAQTNCPAFIPEPLFIDANEEVKHYFVEGRHNHIANALLIAIESFDA